MQQFTGSLSVHLTAIFSSERANTSAPFFWLTKMIMGGSVILFRYSRSSFLQTVKYKHMRLLCVEVLCVEVPLSSVGVLCVEVPLSSVGVVCGGAFIKCGGVVCGGASIKCGCCVWRCLYHKDAAIHV